MRFRLMVFVVFVVIVGLLAWQLYGAHHYPNMNALPGVHHAVVVNSPQFVRPAGESEGW